MLPSFRLIAVTFLCGFAVVFAGLRMAVSLNDMHEGLPVMAAHAAPVTTVAIADQDMRRGQSAVPVMYDMRFAVSRATLAPTLVAATPYIEAPAAVENPAPTLSLAPPSDFIRETLAPLAAEPTPAELQTTIAAIQAAPPAIELPAATTAIVPTVPEAPQPEALKLEAPVVAAIQPTPAVTSEVIAAPIPEAAPAASINVPETKPLEDAETSPAKIAAIDPQFEAEHAPAAIAVEPAAAADKNDVTASIAPPATDPIEAKPEPVKRTVRMPRAKPRAANAAPKQAIAPVATVRKKKRVRTARQAPAASSFGTFNNTSSNPFGSTTQ